MTLKTRQPTGRVPWPLILVEGAEKSGKSWAMAMLSTSPKVGQMYWLDLGEGAADEYAAIPGANYLVIDHNGSWSDILHQVTEVYAVAEQAAKRGDLPVVLGIDSMTAEWDMHKDWATDRARSSKTNQAKLARDPDLEIKVSPNYWNDANERHRKLMRLLMTFPGIVVVTGRGKWVAELDAAGRPVENSKVYKVEGHKNLAYDCSAWVRLSRDSAPLVVGLRSVHTGLRPGVDKPVPEPKLTLEWLIFEQLKCDPATAHIRDMPQAVADRTPEQIATEALLPKTSPERLRELFAEAGALGILDVLVSNGSQEGSLRNLLAYLGKTRAQQGPATDAQHRHMHALWREAGMTDRDDRLAFTNEIVGRLVATSKELTGLEADTVITRLKAWIEQQAAAPAEAGVPA